MAEEEYEGSDCLKIVGFNPCETGAFAMSNKPISPLRRRCHVHAFYLSTPLRAQRAQGGKSSS